MNRNDQMPLNRNDQMPRRPISGNAPCRPARRPGLARKGWFRAALLALAALHAAPGAYAAPEVVVSIKPIHALVAGVMGETGTPLLLVDGAASPHTYQMRPSEAEALESADLIVWVDETLEAFLARPIANLGAGAEIVTLQQVAGMRLLRHREGGIWTGDSAQLPGGEDADDHDSHGEDADSHDSHGEDADDHDSHAHDHGEFDVHIWLDPGNARRIVEAVAAALTRIHPEGAAVYQRNAVSMGTRIAALEASLRGRLAPVGDHAFVVFHDAYQYFERAFEVNVIGAVTLGHDRLPSAKRLAALRRSLVEHDVRCVFSEPQFESSLVETVIEHTTVRTTVLDPLGADVAADADAWFSIMRRIGDSIAGCLGDA